MTRAKSAAHAIEKRIVTSWRLLAGGTTARDPTRKTLLACSAGIDSSALVLALASHIKPQLLVVAHIQHDLRDVSIASQDRLRAEQLAHQCKLKFACEYVHVAKTSGNAEANARTARYAALLELAAKHDCSFIATAHQADDALETLLMRLMRGAGPRGLAALRPTLRKGKLAVIRPMLCISRSDALAICKAHAWSPAVDHTNMLTGPGAPLRARVRNELLPALTTIFPHARETAVRASATQHEVSMLLSRRARRLVRRFTPGSTSHVSSLQIALAQLRPVDDATLHETLRFASRQLTGPVHQDRLPRRACEQIIARIRSRSMHTTTLPLGATRAKISRTTLTILLETA